MSPNETKDLKCPKCRSILKLEKIKGKQEISGDCPNKGCNRSWLISFGDKPGELYAREAVKIGISDDLGSSQMIGPSSFEWYTSDFKFFKINYFQGTDVKIPGKTKVVGIKPFIDIKKIYPLGSEGTIRIDFMFTVQIRPDVCEVNFRGKCLVHSENPERIAAILDTKIDAVSQTIKKDILKSAYPHAKNFVKNKGHNFPPLEFVMENLTIH